MAGRRRYSEVKKDVFLTLMRSGIVSHHALVNMAYTKRNVSKAIIDMRTKGWIEKRKLNYQDWVHYPSTGGILRWKKEEGYILKDVKKYYENDIEYRMYMNESDADIAEETRKSLLRHEEQKAYRSLRQSEILMLISKLLRSEILSGVRYRTSEEIKRDAKNGGNQNVRLSPEESVAFNASRAYGVLIKNKTIYPVYNLGKKEYERLIESQEDSFGQVAAIIEGCERSPETRIVFVRDFSNFENILTKDRFTIMRGTKGKSARVFQNFVTTTSYKHTWILDESEMGRSLLACLLTDTYKNATEKAMQILPEHKSDYTYADKMYIREDGIRIHAYNFLIPDVQHLLHAMRDLQTYLDNTGGQIGDRDIYEVHCLSYYADEVEKIMPKVDIVEYELDEIYELM